MKETTPYIISADAQGLLQNWAETQNVTLPSDEYFRGMLDDLQNYLKQLFPNVLVVEDAELRANLNQDIAEAKGPVISLDRAYVDPKQKNVGGYIDATRRVNSKLEAIGLGSRTDTPLEEQVACLSLRFSGQDVSLIDDVVFEGKTIAQIADQLASEKINVQRIYAGIIINEGKQLLEGKGIEASSRAASLSFDEVIDEICERDFWIGVPLSGRTVVNGNGIIEGAPYFFPFGKPVEWASIPSEEARSFSLFCLSQALQFWSKTEKLTGRAIATQELAKPVRNLPTNNSVSRSIKEVLATFKAEGI